MSENPTRHHPVRLMHCDLNWTTSGAAAPHEWAFVDANDYFNWHMAIGTNVMYCQAYIFGGTAFYPTKLGPVAPGPGGQLFPRLYTFARIRATPTTSRSCAGPSGKSPTKRS